jgi:hypothetical protein
MTNFQFEHGDSKNTIRYFVTDSSPIDASLNIFIECIRISLLNLNVQFYHVNRQNNTKVDAMENKAIGIAPGLWKHAYGKASSCRAFKEWTGY